MRELLLENVLLNTMPVDVLVDVDIDTDSVDFETPQAFVSDFVIHEVYANDRTMAFLDLSMRNKERITSKVETHIDCNETDILESLGVCDE